MPSGTPSMVRTPFTDSDDRELVAFLALHHPSKEGRKGNAVYKLLTEQPNRWPWGKRHTWMSWRERYKNNEARFDVHIKAFQHKNKLSRQAVPMGSEAMLVSGMEDLDDFGTDEEEEDQRPRVNKAARVDSDTEDEDTQPVRTRSRPVSKTVATPKQPTSKRKRVSDAPDRTSKRTRVINGNDDGDLEGEGPTNDPTEEKNDDAMDQDSQGEETQEVEQNLFCASDTDSLAIPHHSRGGNAPKISTQPPQSSGPVASSSQNQRTPRPRKPIHRPYSPKNPPSSAFSTVDLDESDTDSPVVPKRLWNRRVPKIVESAFGRNEQSSPVRSSQIPADSSPGFDLLVERRAARKVGAPKRLQVRTTREDMSWEELQGLQCNTPEPGPSSSSTSKRGSVEPRGSSPLSPSNGPLSSRSRPKQVPSNTIDATQRKMIEAREELSRVALRFRSRLPRSPLGSNFHDTIMDNDETHPFDETTHPFDETTHPFDETTQPLDETSHPFDDSQTQIQEIHPFDEDSCVPSQETHPFDEDTQQPDNIVDSQRRRPEAGTSNIQTGISPAPPTPGSSKRRTEAFLTTSLLESRNGRHSRSPSHPPPVSPIDRLRPGVLSSPSHLPRSPQTSRNPPQSPRPSTKDVPILSPQRVRSGCVSPEDGRPKSTVTRELRELLENSPRRRRTPANVEVQSQAHEKPPKTSERKQPAHRARLSEPSVKPETTTPGHHLRSKSAVDDDPFSSPTGLRLSSPHPPTDATIPEAEPDSPLAPVTTSQNGLDATIKSRQVRREVTQGRNRRVHDSERPNSSVSPRAITVVATGTTPRKGKGVVEAPTQIDEEQEDDLMDESQTYDIERDRFNVSETPMMDLSFRPPRRIPPTYRTSSRTHHRTSSSTTVDARDRDHERERDRDVRKSSSSRYQERGVRDVQDDREQRRDSRRLPGVSFGSPVAESSPQNIRRNGQSYDRPDGSTSFSSRTSIGSSTSTLSPAVGIMAGPLGLGFTPSETDAYLGIQIACEKMAKTHGFQSDAVLRVYQEVKDLRKAEEIVIGMKRAAEKDAIERIMKAREKNEKRRMNERSAESSSYWDRGGGQSRTSRRSNAVRDEEEDDQDTDNRIIHEEEEEDPDSPLMVEHLSHRNKRSSTSALRHRGGYDRPKVSTTAVTTRERDQVRDREGDADYHPPTPTRANLWERLSRSGRHPEAALLGESLRASLSVPRYEAVDHD